MLAAIALLRLVISPAEAQGNLILGTAAGVIDTMHQVAVQKAWAGVDPTLAACVAGQYQTTVAGVAATGLLPNSPQLAVGMAQCRQAIAAAQAQQAEDLRKVQVEEQQKADEAAKKKTDQAKRDAAQRQQQMEAQAAADREALKALGFYDDAANANVVRTTRKAIAAYQRSLDHSLTGILTNAERASLNVAAHDALAKQQEHAIAAAAAKRQEQQPSGTSAVHRIALVIGNATYHHVPVLTNAVNDARLIADTLKRLGFDLIDGGPQIDLDKAQIEHSIREFGNQLSRGAVGLFYYSGHGLQIGGINYLVPVAANPTKASDADFELVDADLVLKQMEEGGASLNIMILDACRNNPFAGRGLRAIGTGLAEMRAPEGTVISFATQPGGVAGDGVRGDVNGPYSRALAAAIMTPGLDVFHVFNEVGLMVKRETAGAQQPWVSSSPIEGDFVFLPKVSTPSTASSSE
jgi:hypothetical protein